MEHSGQNPRADRSEDDRSWENPTARSLAFAARNDLLSTLPKKQAKQQPLFIAVLIAVFTAVVSLPDDPQELRE
jgi:hypothetical protein